MDRSEGYKRRSLTLEFKNLATNISRNFRIHYERKYEFRLQAGEIKTIALAVKHPLLLQYHEPMCPLQLISEVADKACFMDHLSVATYEVFHGWRQAVDYCFIPPEKFIEKGYGILIEAPQLYVYKVAKTAASCGVELVPGKARKPRAPLAKVLIMDETYVIADGFRLEELD